MTGLKSKWICAALVLALGACSADRSQGLKQDPPADFHCREQKPGGEDETDGGLGGTGKVPDDCRPTDTGD